MPSAQLDSLKGESIICFAGEDWWYHHPHSKNHLLKRYAHQNTVLFVNSITMGLPSMANPDFFLKIRRKLKSYLRWLRKVPEGLWVMTPINLPFYGSRPGRWVNRILLLAQLRLAMLLVRMTQPILWIAIPTAAEMAGRLNEKLLLYQVSDKYDANEDSALSIEVIRTYDRQLKDAADVVLYSGRKLFAESTEPHRFFLEQAVDFEHFSQPSTEPAMELKDIPNPILGYFGSMDYVMDTELMAEVAKLRPHWHWVLLGLKSNLIRLTAPNIRFLGSKPYHDLPRYIARFNVCVLPWRAQNAFTSYGSAIKVREYLATGKPVVMAPLYEYLETPGLRFYRGAEQFIQQVEAALEQGHSGIGRAASGRRKRWHLGHPSRRTGGAPFTPCSAAGATATHLPPLSQKVFNDAGIARRYEVRQGRCVRCAGARIAARGHTSAHRLFGNQRRHRKGLRPGRTQIITRQSNGAARSGKAGTAVCAVQWPARGAAEGSGATRYIIASGLLLLGHRTRSRGRNSRLSARRPRRLRRCRLRQPLRDQLRPRKSCRARTRQREPAGRVPHDDWRHRHTGCAPGKCNLR